MPRKLLFAFFTLWTLTPILTPAQQLAPSIQWQKCLGGSHDDKANAILRTMDNGFLIVGSSNSNDGDVSGHHGSTDSSDAWIVKVSSSGTVEWQKSLGGTGVDAFNSVTRTSDGNYVCMGTSTSSDGDVSGYHGGGETDLWVVMISSSGSIIWSKCYGGTHLEIPGNIRQNRDGTFYMIGTTESNDGDVSGNHSQNDDIWVLKLNGDGSILWQRCIGGSNRDQGFDITEATDGNGFLMGVDILSFDGDIPISGGPSPNGYVVKTDSTKIVQWKSNIYMGDPIQVTAGDANNYYINANVDGCSPQLNNFAAAEFRLGDVGGTPSLTRLGNYTYCTGNPGGPFLDGYHTKGVAGFMPVNGTNYLFACTSDDTVNNPAKGFHGGIYDGFISGIGPSGVSWNKFIGGSAEDDLNSVIPLDGTDFVVSGYTKSNDGNVTGNHGGFDFWIVKLGNINNIYGSVFLDYNANGIKDITEPFADNILVQSAKTGMQTANLTNLNGQFSNLVDTGSYTTQVLSTLAYYAPVPALHSSIFSNYNNLDSISFALQPIPAKRDYSAQLISLSPFRPGSDVTYVLWYANDGTDTLNNKSIRLIKDSRLQFLSASPSQVSITGDTINWTIPQLDPRMHGQITVQLKVGIPPVVNIGDTLSSTMMIDTTGDLTPANNIAILRSPITGSFDPNGKTESNGGSISQEYAGKNKYLSYTVFFQNTGTDTAFNITVRDTLSDKLIPSSLEMIGSSHPYQLSIRNGNQLVWTFTNILLPDSIHNEQASHGYLSYRVKPKNTLIPGDNIINSAGIYFDYNLPVQTNAQITHVVEQVAPPPVLPFPPAPAVSGLASSYCIKRDVQKLTITNIQPPADSVTVSARLDNTTLQVGTGNTISFMPAALSPGQHSMIVVFSNSTGSDTTRLNFGIVPASTPVIGLGSNVSNVTGSSGDVIITATNVAGGGSDPSFTFAKDSSFTQLFQAESTLNTLTLAASDLQPGSNQIYARMRTSDTCYTIQTVRDSLIITRNVTTGLTDVDYPNQVINASPNPFYDHLTITGLQTTKAYTLQLLNNSGQELIRQRVMQNPNITLNTPLLSTGIYLLRIYDETKNRLIGTVRLSVL